MSPIPKRRKRPGQGAPDSQHDNSSAVIKRKPAGAQAVAPDRQQDTARWRVIWENYRGHHDWIGRRPQRGAKTQRKATPKQQFREFFTREAAENFVASLRRDFGDEVAVQIINITQLLPPRPAQQSFAADWPLRRRGDAW